MKMRKLEQLHNYPEIKEHLQKILPYRNIKNQLTVDTDSDLLLNLNRIVIPETLPGDPEKSIRV